ncbi:unnamed protein product [Plutella xylostella]|uniref:UDP-glucuronosyltransferase n=1 Tax=Plutella xylostella TaxID=51655 RepID=A0A8S4G4R6_PLUXY|nr:unnamed protein product [Plutella xylostella]
MPSPPLLLLACCLLIGCSAVSCYRVLAVFPVASRSHATLGRGVVDALLADGHEVTFITPYPENKNVKNLKEIDVSVTQKVIKAINMMDEANRHGGPDFVKAMSLNVSRAMMATPAVQQALLTGRFDAVVTEWFFNEYLAGFAETLQVPWVLLNGMVYHPYLEQLVDAPQSPAILPMMANDYPVPMSFIERVKNTFIVGMMLGTYAFKDKYEFAEVYEELFAPLATSRGVQLRPFDEASADVAVVLLNSHPALAHVQSVPPNVIDVAGYHLDESPKPLPQDLQTLLDNSKQGFVYFSMGSVLKSANFPAHTRQALLKVFEKLPYTVLWKFEEAMDGLPKNVHVRAWMPQQSILAHPNIKLFITHGGMLSSVEAIHYGVPLLAIPMFGDQPSNAQRAARRGYAISVPFSPDMTPQVEEALGKLLSDDTYYKTAKSLSAVFRARPTTPRKLIAHYVRLAIESKGAHHLRTKTHLYPWYQRLLLDQLLVLLLIILFVIRMIEKLFIKLFLSAASTKDAGKKKVKRN